MIIWWNQVNLSDEIDYIQISSFQIKKTNKLGNRLSSKTFHQLKNKETEINLLSETNLELWNCCENCEFVQRSCWNKIAQFPRSIEKYQQTRLPQRWTFTESINEYYNITRVDDN